MKDVHATSDQVSLRGGIVVRCVCSLYVIKSLQRDNSLILNHVKGYANYCNNTRFFANGIHYLYVS